ncbi:MAG: type II secretion system protein [Deltaproteobacteria bacterium HGW-Deltaproteobacteria-4]|nr:MAG: type II secretion system protein [Deltaproteobacteria bacterium HGW-Deltaproteobacteria-4]
MKPKTRSLLLLLSIMLLALQLSGCAGSRAYSRGQDFYAQGNYDKSVLNYMEAVETAPDRQEYRLRLSEALNKAAWQHLEEGRRLLKERQAAEAATEFRRALEYDKTLVAATNELAIAEEILKVDRLVQQADDLLKNRRLPQAKNSIDQALLIDPENVAALGLRAKVQNTPKTIIDGVELDVTSTKPISLKFKNTDIKDAFNILSKLSGVNFILDESLKRQSFTFDLAEVSFPQALELIMQMNKLGKKVLNSRTIIIYSRSKDGDKQFTDHLIQTFYLSNIDAKKAVNLLRTMLQLRKVYVHEELNAIIIRDTADVIKLAGQMLEAADRADAEVMFDLEMIEVNDSSALKLGPLLSPASISFGLGKPGEIVTTGTSGTTTTTSADVIVGSSLSSGGSTKNLVSGGINGLSGLSSYYSLPTLTFDFLKTRTDAEILANPKIRVKNKEKAKVHIGSKEPVITVTANGDVFTDSVAYVDVGVKLNIEPTIQLDNSVVTKVELEVSSVSGRQTTSRGTQVLTLTSTNANTVLTLKDGERTIIGGLIRDDTSKSRSGIVLLSDLPFIGTLFTNHNNSKNKRELLLSITPHIVQNIVVPSAGVGTLWSGREDDLKSGPVFGAFTSYEDEAAITPPQSQPVEAPVLSSPKNDDPVVIPSVGPAAVQPDDGPLAATDGSLLLIGPGQMSVGDEIEVIITGLEMNSLFSAPLFVTFDQNLFELVTVIEGDLLNRDGIATVFSSNPVQGKGELMVGYKQEAGGSGVSGDGTLLSVVFKAKAPGVGQFSVDRLNLRNTSGQRLKVLVTPLTVEVK